MRGASWKGVISSEEVMCHVSVDLLVYDRLKDEECELTHFPGGKNCL